VAIKPCSVGTQLETSTLIKVALLIHNLSTFAIFPLTGEDAKVFKDYQRLSEHYQEVVAALFAARTRHRDAGWWRRFIWSGRDRFLGPEECLELGLVDRIDEPSLVDQPGFRVGHPPANAATDAPPPDRPGGPAAAR